MEEFAYCIRIVDNKVEINGNFPFFFKPEDTKSMKVVDKVKVKFLSGKVKVLK